MSNVNVLTVLDRSAPPTAEEEAWERAQARAASAWAKVARVHKRLAKLYAARDAESEVEYVGGSVLPTNDKEEAFNHKMLAINAEIKALEARVILLDNEAERASEDAEAALEAAASC